MATSSAFLPAPNELELVTLRVEPTRIVVVAATRRATAACPRCGTRSRRVHSRYTRTLADLPVQETAVQIELHTRKFFCDEPRCPQRIFTERLPKTARRSARRTERLHAVLEELGFMTGGEMGARLAALLGLATSPATLLRYVRGKRPVFPGGHAAAVADPERAAFRRRAT